MEEGKDGRRRRKVRMGGGGGEICKYEEGEVVYCKQINFMSIE